jgi:hypothetical protein
MVSLCQGRADDMLRGRTGLAHVGRALKWKGMFVLNFHFKVSVCEPHHAQTHTEVIEGTLSLRSKSQKPITAKNSFSPSP